MATEKLNFKFGNSEKLSTATIADGDFVAVNESMGVESPTEVEAKLGSIYKGDKILGTTIADKLVTNEEILITEGSPISALGVFTDNKIPAGTSVQDILLKLLCQELYPETSIAANGSFSVTLGNPTITANVTKDTTVEVGSTVTVSAIKSGKDTISKTAAKVSGFTYGYKDTEDGELVDADSVSADWSSTASGEYSITASATGFTGLVNTTASGEDYTAVTLASQDLKVALGTNTLSVSATGRSYSATREAIASKFIVSNAGGVSAEHKSQEVAGASSTYTDANGASASYSVTGVYPVYNNISGSAFVATPATRFALSKGSSFELSSVPSEIASGNPLMIDYPASKTVSSFQLKDPSGQWATFAGEYNVDSIGEFDKEINGVTYKYKRFATAGGNGAGNTYKITFNSGMNS